MKSIVSTVIFFVGTIIPTFGQVINNPGFEDTPQDATTPQGWLECEQGTTPDILPGFWGVKTLPHQGQTYIGLITRGDGSYESIGQRIHPPLSPKSCYETSIALCKSRKYVGYHKSIQVKIFIGKDRCSKDQLIFTSPEIKHRKWKEYPVSFETELEANYLIIEVFAEKEGRKGHVLIDKLDPISLCAKAML